MYFRFDEHSLILYEGWCPYTLVVRLKEQQERFSEEFGISAAYYTAFGLTNLAIDLRRMRCCA